MQKIFTLFVFLAMGLNVSAQTPAPKPIKYEVKVTGTLIIELVPLVTPTCVTDVDCDDNLFCNGAETCVNGSCIAGPTMCTGQFCDESTNTCVECISNSDCADEFFCNGTEICTAGTCTLGLLPCPGQLCNEITDSCIDCFVDATCNDGLFCNGAETCSGNNCIPGTAPCATGELCNESTDSCVVNTTNMIYVATNGNNSSGTGSISSPYQTIQHGFNMAAPGDTVIVQGGIYTVAPSTSSNARILKVLPGEGGSMGLPITVKAADGESVILDGDDSGTNPLHLMYIQGQYINIEGLELRDINRSGILAVNPAHDVNIRFCHVHNFSKAASTKPGIGVVGPATNIVIEDCLVNGSTTEFGGVGIFLDEVGGLSGADKVPPNGSDTRYPAVAPANWSSWPGYVDNAPKDCTIRRCVVFNMLNSVEGSDGIAINYAIGGSITDNIVFSNADDAIDGLGATRCEFARNICFDSNTLGSAGGDGNGIKIGVRGGLENIAHHNICFDNPRAGIDFTISYRSKIYNNTLFNNGWRGISFGESVGQMQENPFAMEVINNVAVDGGPASFAVGYSAAYDQSLVTASNNVVSDDNIHGGNTPFLGTDLVISAVPADMFTNPTLSVNTTFPSGLTIPQKLAFIRDQLTAKLSPRGILIDSGAVIPGTTDGFTGAAPEIGAIEFK